MRIVNDKQVVVNVLPSREAGLFLGIILGVRDKIDNNFYEKLREVGVLHIIAASGQNVSILASILLVTLEQFVKRKKALLFTALGIGFYALIAGFDPPIVRASIMALISFGALALGRQSTGIYALLLTGWGMMIIKPDSLIDISFQLSFLSTLGIITIKPLLDNIFSKRLFFILKEDLTTTLSAQIATFPLMIAVFGSYSLITLPVNLLVLWTIPIIMVTGVIGSTVALVAPILAKPFLFLTLPLLVYFTNIVDLASGFDLSFSFESIPGAFICGYYLILIALLIKLKTPKRGKF